MFFSETEKHKNRSLITKTNKQETIEMEGRKNVALIATIGIVATMLMTSVALATAPELKLPYQGGESWDLTQAYNGITHQGLDYYALDFALPRCDAYDKPVLAVASGTVIEVDSGHSHGEANSYGNKVVIKHESGYTSLYGHLNQILVQKDQKVAQGKKIGTVGNTGYCLGSKCKEYPGTHLHFRMLDKDGNAYKPEPMSGYTNFATGQRPLSDNYGNTWNFNTPGNAEGWKAVNAEESSVNGGRYFVNPKQTDPYIQSASLSLSSDDYNAIEINMASNCPDGNARIYFTTTDSPEYSEDKRVSFKANNDGGWHTYTVYMAGDLWKGATITALLLFF